MSGRGHTESKIDPFVADLGLVSDVVIAKRAGVCRERVRQVRAKLGIESKRSVRIKEILDYCRAHTAVDAADAFDTSYASIVGTCRDRGVKPVPLVRDRKSRAFLAKHAEIIGHMPDWEAAKLLGCTHNWIYALRRKYGIPAQREKPGGTTGKRVAWTEEMLVVLYDASLTQREAAKQLGVCPQWVYRKRKERRDG